MRFAELIAALAAADERPEDADAQLMEAYEFDTSVHTAKIGELESINAELNTVVAQLKAHNYDLLVNGAAGDADEEPADEGGEDDNVSIDDLFDEDEE